MHLHAAVCVFESWTPSREYPEQVGNVQCCGRPVIMRAGEMACEACDTAISRQGEAWIILRVKGRAFPPGGRSDEA